MRIVGQPVGEVDPRPERHGRSAPDLPVQDECLFEPIGDDRTPVRLLTHRGAQAASLLRAHLGRGCLAAARVEAERRRRIAGGGDDLLDQRPDGCRVLGGAERELGEGDPRPFGGRVDRQRGEHLGVQVGTGTLAAAATVEVLVRDDDAGLTEPDVTHPAGPGLVERVEEGLAAGGVGPADRHPTVPAVRPDVGDVPDGELPGERGGQLDELGQAGRVGMGVEADRPAEPVTGPLEQAVEDHAGFVALQVAPHDWRCPIRGERPPQGDRGEATPSELRHCPVGVDDVEHRMVGHGGVPDGAEVHATHRGAIVTGPLGVIPASTSLFPVVTSAADRYAATLMDEIRLEHLMDAALDEARAAAGHGDVPVGAVVARIDDGDILARAHNERERRGDPTAHAELLAMRAAAAELGGWRLDGCVLVVTLEPCAMCAGAAVNARIGMVAFGAADPKAGACGSLYNLAADPRLNHEFPLVDGVRADECATLLRDFFSSRRGSAAG